MEHKIFWQHLSFYFRVTGPLIRICLTAAAAAAKSLQSCPTLCDPTDGSPPGSPVPGILQARSLEWVAISFSNAWKWKVNVKSLSRVRLCATPWTAAHQAPPSMGFSRQEYWSGVPLPSLIISLAIYKIQISFFFLMFLIARKFLELINDYSKVSGYTGNGNPVQCSCLENPRDGGAWWAAICGVPQSRTRLKRLSSSSRRIHLVMWNLIS